MSYSRLNELGDREEVEDQDYEVEKVSFMQKDKSHGYIGFERTIQGLSLLLMAILCTLLLIHILSTKATVRPVDIEFMTKYGEDLRYMSLGHEHDHLWAGYLPRHEGLIKVTSEVAGVEPRYELIGMFHQLHCLAHFRLALQKARGGIDIGMDWRDDNHWPHCLDYMRQAILCAADATREQPLVLNGSQILRISGAEDIRKCKESKPLFELLSAKAAYNDSMGTDV